MNGSKDVINTCKHTEKNIIQASKKKKKGDPVIFNKMNEPRAHYAEWNKPDRDKSCMVLLTCRSLKEIKTHAYRVEK